MSSSFFEIKVRTVGRSRNEAICLLNDVINDIERNDCIVQTSQRFEDNTLFECIIVEEKEKEFE